MALKPFDSMNHLLTASCAEWNSCLQCELLPINNNLRKPLRSSNTSRGGIPPGASIAAAAVVRTGPGAVGLLLEAPCRRGVGCPAARVC